MIASGSPTESIPTNLQTVAEFEQWELTHSHEGSYEFVRGRIIDRGGIEQKLLHLHIFLSRLFNLHNPFSGAIY